ncbi:rod shape-determining protein MreC [Clostridium oceanicum]|uniref:Cell shape-determining protein MreC n=1 Tax=Clostridium oceanicum TaxID=1543 RepID=A0ABN1JVM0_9CLOT
MKIFKNKLAVTIILLSVTFLILITQSVGRSKLSFVESGVGSVLNPIQGVFYKTNQKIKNYIGFVLNIPDVKKENNDLKKKNSELEKKLIENKLAVKENERLRKALNFKNQHSQYDYIGCDIISKSGSGYIDEFTINRGTKDGVGKDMIAITSEGLFGKVIQAGSNWSKVQSISNENLAVSAMVESTGENNGIVKGYKDGSNNLLARLEFLPMDSKVKKGDDILTSGTGGFYPKGLRIGKVILVQEDKGKIMKTAVIKPSANLEKVQEIFIVVPKNKVKVEY